MTSGDLLLSWASCHRELRIARIRAAATRLCAPPIEFKDDDPRRDRYREAAKRHAWNLLRLAHVELHGGDRFRIVPPTIVSNGGNGHFLVGARDEALVDRLMRETGERICSVPQYGAPSVLTFQADDDVVGALTSRLRIARFRDRGLDVLASLPALGALLQNAPLDGLPDRCEKWERQCSGGRRSEWVQVRSNDGDPGLYRTVRKPRQWYFWPHDSGRVLRLDTSERRSAAGWTMMRQSSLSHHRERRELNLPAGPFGLPLLVDRSLILASGRLPQRDAQGWTYLNIDHDRARQLARIVGLRLEERE